MEQLEILNEDGISTGLCKDRADVHRDGDLHGSSHVWIIRDLQKDGNFSVLLQQRSATKDAFPNCLDTSCAGHVTSGETFCSTAIRELEEELSIKPEEEIIFLFDHSTCWEAEFSGPKFINHEICRVYLLHNVSSINLKGFQKKGDQQAFVAGCAYRTYRTSGRRSALLHPAFPVRKTCGKSRSDAPLYHPYFRLLV
jgi:8-oxo-dGTP diphosphatase